MFQKTLIFQKNQNSFKMTNLISSSGMRRECRSIYDSLDKWLITTLTGFFYGLLGRPRPYSFILISQRKPPIIGDSRIYQKHQSLHWRSKTIG